MERYDVAVAGGGPAGLAAGYEASQRGADTIVIEAGVPREDRDRQGPDSTDAAGLLDYWIDILDIPLEEIPDEIIHQEVSGATFHGPSEDLHIERTGIDASYEAFGLTFDRVKMDDWLTERAETAGTTIAVGSPVTTVDVQGGDDEAHIVEMGDGTQLAANALILADGPGRRVTNQVLDEFMPAGDSVTDYLGTRQANHIAYQEFREFPDEAFDQETLHFWWGAMPGETAYPWVFPTSDGIAKVGLTMPIGLSLEDITNPEDYWLLEEDDESLPDAETYIERLLSTVFPEYELSDFPRVKERGKNAGTETYPISSTHPVDSPTAANVAVVGGAMGATSAFHEGGYHVAVRTGAIAGKLAATDRLTEFNDAWKTAIGDEVRRNVTFGAIVKEYEPADWDRVFRVTADLINNTSGRVIGPSLSAGVAGLKLYGTYWWTKRQFANGKYVQLPESVYEY